MIIFNFRFKIKNNIMISYNSIYKNLFKYPCLISADAIKSAYLVIIKLLKVKQNIVSLKLKVNE